MGEKLVNVDIDKDLYVCIKKLIYKNKYVYPSIKFFVQRAIYNELQVAHSEPSKEEEQ